MSKINLGLNAANLSSVSHSTFIEYQNKSVLLLAEINHLMSNEPNLNDLIGFDNFNMMKDNHANHVKFIASIIKNYSPEVWVNTLIWVFRAYRNHGFQANYWTVQLNGWIKIINKELSAPSAAEIVPFYRWIQNNLHLLKLLSDKAEV